MAGFRQLKRSRYPASHFFDSTDFNIAIERVFIWLPFHQLLAHQDQLVINNFLWIADRTESPSGTRLCRLRSPCSLRPAGSNILFKIKFIGEGENAKKTVDEIHTAAIDSVHILIYDDITVTGKNHLALFPDKIINLAIGWQGITQIPGSWTTENQTTVVMESLSTYDIWMLHDKVPDSPGLRPGKRIRTGTTLDIIRLPVKAEIPVHVISTWTVFINQTVSVIVNPF